MRRTMHAKRPRFNHSRLRVKIFFAAFTRTAKKSKLLPCARRNSRTIPVIHWKQSKLLILQDFFRMRKDATGHV